MNETSFNFLNAKKKNSTTDGPQPCNYKIISINKDEKTNQHSIRIGIDGDLPKKNVDEKNSRECNCANDPTPLGRIPYQINPSSPSVPPKWVSLKTMPGGQGTPRILKTSSRKVSTEDSAFLSPSNDRAAENVDGESCKKVSTARAMFERMASTSSENLRSTKAKPHLKSWNSSTLLDNNNCDETDSPNLNAKPTKAAHAHSRSLPAEITNEVCHHDEKSSYAHKRGTSSSFVAINNKHMDYSDNDVCKTRVIYDDETENVTTDTCIEYSNNNCNTNTTITTINNNNNSSSNSYNNNYITTTAINDTNNNYNHNNYNNSSSIHSSTTTTTATTTTTTTTNTVIYHHGSRSESTMYSGEDTLEQQMAALPSYSSEDLRHYGKDDTRGRPVSTSSQNNSANELRQATSNYHQYLMKNNPRLRNTIGQKDNKFLPRKTSLPIEDEFVRGEYTRATIATSTAPRYPRSYSTSDTLEIKDLNDVLSKTSENSMMSRLLRDSNNTTTLMKIDEEIKSASATVGNVKVVIRRNSSDGPDQNTNELHKRHNSDKLCYDYSKSSKSCSSIDSSIDPEKNDKHLFMDTQRMHRYSGARSTGSIPEMKSISIQTDDRLQDDDGGVSCLRSGSIDSQLNVDHSKMKHQHPSRGDTTSSKRLVEEDALSEKNSLSASAEQLSSTCTDIDLKLSFNTIKEGEIIDNAALTDTLCTETDIDAEEITDLHAGYTPDVDVGEIPDIGTGKSPDICGEEIPDINTGELPDIGADEIPDIDVGEMPDIMHQKDLSTDSAVYEISHTKALSNESTDSLQEYSDLPYKHFEHEGCLPDPPTHDILPYEYPCDDSNEKEKPQRTINRRKKPVNSRNNSCVSIDSTESTATIDSGIVLCSEPTSQRASPMSNDSSYYNKDLNGSRETLDDDVAALSDESGLMSTPDRNEEAKNAGYQLLGKTYANSLNESSPSSSAGGSRRGSMNSPRADLDNEKAKLVGSMREKISELRDQEQEIADEITMNNELGKKVMSMVETKATQVEFSKFELFIGELNKIVALLLSLTQRLHRYELMLQDLDMSNEEDIAKKDGLISKIDKLKSQHEEACYLRDVNDKRGEVVASFLGKYCTEEEFSDFQHYVDMKSQLSLMQSAIREKVKLGEERLKALELTSSEWGFK